MRTILLGAIMLLAVPAWATSENDVSVWARALDGSGESLRVTYIQPTSAKGRAPKGILSIRHPTPAPKNAVSLPEWAAMRLNGPNGSAKAKSHDGKVSWTVSLAFDPRTQRGKVQATAKMGCGRSKAYSSNFKIVPRCQLRSRRR